MVLGVLLALVIKTFATGARSEDLLGSYICAGIGGALMAQIAVNVGMNLRVLPVIGVTLPFYSAGGSSVLMLYILWEGIRFVPQGRPYPNRLFVLCI